MNASIPSNLKTGDRSAEQAVFTRAHFVFLDNLRESGVTNMLAAAPWVKRRFSVSNDRASDILRAWMKTFDDKSSAEDRAKAANTDLGSPVVTSPSNGASP